MSDCMQDRNFDDLAVQFSNRIYSGTKGRIRLALLERDLDECLGDAFVAGSTPLRVLDAGGGEGQFARSLARRGHKLTLCDHSQVMIENARQAAERDNLAGDFHFLPCSIQSLPDPDPLFDLVLCHAVLEWVSDWQGVVTKLITQMAPGAVLSLMFYNQHSTVFRSLVRGYFDRIKQDKLAGSGQGLTPLYPLLPEQVLAFMADQGMAVLCQSGIRVFHDYMHKDIRERRSEQDIIALEKQFSRVEPYRSLGRYYHILARTTS
ncbi:MAG: methyltransferase domain-containing protein [Ketobacter sp.]|nr:methyltransferase domain-containing protein [Ketobacter sp.]